MGTTAESFHLPGIFPIVIEMLNNFVKLGAIGWAVALSIPEDTPSGPEALLVPTALPSSILRTSSPDQSRLCTQRRTEWKFWQSVGGSEILQEYFIEHCSIPCTSLSFHRPIRKSGIWVLFLLIVYDCLPELLSITFPETFEIASWIV